MGATWMAAQRAGVNYGTNADVVVHAERAAKRAGDLLAAEIRELAMTRLEEYPVESPIEAIFAAWFVAMKRTHGDFFCYAFELMPQEWVQAGGHDYRLDFEVWLEDPDLIIEGQRLGVKPFESIAVELDGHDFHERTKDQVTQRNQRDRDLQASGWKVFHFSGSEVHRDPEACVNEVMEYASRALFAFERRITNAKKAESK